MDIYYHGSSVLFDKFDLSHALEGDGKIKFGFGVYLSPKYHSAAHYSGKNRDASAHYVYTVQIPELTEDNHIDFHQPVHPNIVCRAEQKLGLTIPQEAIDDGNPFRKFIAKTLHGSLGFAAEKAASEFLLSIGVEYITRPFSWRNLSLGIERVMLDTTKINIIKIEQVELDCKQQLVTGSQKTIFELP